MNPFESKIEELNQEEELNFRQVFAVTDLESAAEATRRISFFEDKKAEIDEVVKNQLEPLLEKIEKIKEWGEAAKKEYTDKQDHYSSYLEAYLRDEIKKQVDAGKKPKQSISLPFGKISIKKQQPEFIKNEAELMEYAKENGFVKVKKEVDWAAIKKGAHFYEGVMIDSDGIVVPGIKVIERPDKFEFKGEKKND